MSAGDPVAIEVRDLQKSFRIPLERHDTIKERAIRPSKWGGAGSRQLEALRGISFDVARGEFFGVMGRNGCGKSTLLKLLASIYRLDGGSVRIAGRLAPFIELGVGFHPELTARDNVLLNGVMMGLSPVEARRRFDAVIDYAELWDYTELKLKNYSSGMNVRLAFALMLQVDADILLVDEVLAVGDAAFQAKCEESLDERRARGTTIVFVTHSMETVKRHCDRAMLIEKGKIELIGSARDVTERYIEVLFAPGMRPPGSDEEGQGTVARVSGAEITDARGQTVEAVAQGEPFTLNLRVRAEEHVPQLRLIVQLINNPEGVKIASFGVGDDAELAPLGPDEEATARIELDNELRPGNYRFTYVLAVRDGEGLRILDRAPEPVRLTVLGTDFDAGVVHLKHRVAVDRDTRGARR